MPIKYQVISDVLSYNNSLNSRLRVLALVNRGWKHGQDKIVLESSITATNLQEAEKVLLAHGMI